MHVTSNPYLVRFLRGRMHCTISFKMIRTSKLQFASVFYFFLFLPLYSMNSFRNSRQNGSCLNKNRKDIFLKMISNAYVDWFLSGKCVRTNLRHGLDSGLECPHCVAVAAQKCASTNRPCYFDVYDKQCFMIIYTLRYFVIYLFYKYCIHAKII